MATATDFKKLLAEKRLQKSLDKVKSDAAPNMHPISWTRERKVEEPQPPDLKELDLPKSDETKLTGMIKRHVEVTATIGKLTKEKKVLTEAIKPLCKLHGLDKFMVEGNKSNYYKTTRKTISKELLLMHGVAPAIIEASTVETESWSFKSTAGVEDEPE